MVTQYPLNIDTLITLPEAQDSEMPIGLSKDRFNDLNKAIIAIETELGQKPGASSNVRTRLDSLESVLGNAALIIGGDLGGSATSPKVIGIDGYAILYGDQIKNNQVLMFSNNNWVPKYLYLDISRPPFTIKIVYPFSTLLEIGETLTNPSFFGEYTESASDLVYATLKDSDNNIEEDILLSDPESFSSSYSFNKINLGDEVIFTLKSASNLDPSLFRTKSITFRWGQNVYWGSASSTTINSSFITSLSNNELSLDYKKNINIVIPNDQYFYFAIPSSFESSSTPAFLVNDFEGGFTLEATNVQITNFYGVVQYYNVYRSDNPSLGPTNIIVF